MQEDTYTAEIEQQQLDEVERLTGMAEAIRRLGISTEEERVVAERLLNTVVSAQKDIRVLSPDAEKDPVDGKVLDAFSSVEGAVREALQQYKVRASA